MPRATDTSKQDKELTASVEREIAKLKERLVEKRDLLKRGQEALTSATSC